MSVAHRALPTLGIILGELRAAEITSLQVNVDKLCNQACKHCHVDASPHRSEVVTRETAVQVVEL
jgi:MoaA/NifB/PqqE/SkfB family radical SAM enzyme